MNDPFGSFGGFMQQFRRFMANPIQFLTQKKMMLPQGAMEHPQEAVQQLLNSGQMSQQQFNRLQDMARKIQSNPQFAQMFGK